MAMVEDFAFQVLNSVSWGLILALVALGLSIIFGWLEVINIAHGALYSLGGVISYYAFFYLNSWAVSFLIVPIVLTGVGAAIYYSVIKPSLETKTPFTTSLMVTYGVMFIVEQLILIYFGGTPEAVTSPITGSFAIPLLNVSFPYYRVFISIASLGIIGGVWYFLNATRIGAWTRAAKQDREMASALGIPVDRIYLFVFILGSIMAGIGGLMVAPVTGVSFDMGTKIIIAAFVIVIAAGLGSFKGIIVVALFFAVTRGVLATFIQPTMAEAFAYAALFVLLFFKPRGLYPEV